MSLNNKIKLKYQKIIRYKAWLLCLLSATLILSCTDDIDNGGAALLGPSFGLSVIPQNTTILKAGAQIFTATGGVAPYTFYIANTSKGTSLGTMVPATGVFTGVEALGCSARRYCDGNGSRFYRSYRNNNYNRTTNHLNSNTR